MLEYRIRETQEPGRRVSSSKLKRHADDYYVSITVESDIDRALWKSKVNKQTGTSLANESQKFSNVSNHL